jgi:hypothetical protein
MGERPLKCLNKEGYRTYVRQCFKFRSARLDVDLMQCPGKYPGSEIFFETEKKATAKKPRGPSSVGVKGIIGA